jgi:hypothetical protein
LRLKGQVATENILMVAIGFMVLIPLIALFYDYSTDQTDEIMAQQVGKVGREIVDNAETVYYMGEPSRIALDVSFPDTIKSIQIVNDRELVFYVGASFSEAPYYADVKLDGVFYETLGNPCTDVNGEVIEEACFSPGVKTLVLVATPTNVSIIIG